MKNAFLFLFIIGLAISFACQNKLDKDEEIITTVQGNVKNVSNTSLQDATVDIDSIYITNTDASGDFSLSVTHTGTFTLNAAFATRTQNLIYSETINTEEVLIKKTITVK